MTSPSSTSAAASPSPAEAKRSNHGPCRRGGVRARGRSAPPRGTRGRVPAAPRPARARNRRVRPATCAQGIVEGAAVVAATAQPLPRRFGTVRSESPIRRDLSTVRLSPMAEPTTDDVDVLLGSATPHFAYQLRARVAELIADLPPDHPVRRYGEEKMDLMDRLGHASSLARRLRAGAAQPDRLGDGPVVGAGVRSASSPQRMSFDGASVLVTGGSRGIGKAIARRFASLGASARRDRLHARRPRGRRDRVRAHRARRRAGARPRQRRVAARRRRGRGARPASTSSSTRPRPA